MRWLCVSFVWCVLLSCVLLRVVCLWCGVWCGFVVLRCLLSLFALVCFDGFVVSCVVLFVLL